MSSFAYPLSLNIDAFPDCFSTARASWLSALDDLPLPCERREFIHPATGPEGEVLTTDVAWIGPAGAGKVLVLICATHGIEGYAGTGVLIDCLRLLSSGQLALPEDTALVSIHGLNPWGYAWDRRCDDQGIDVNRNFIDFDNPPDNPGYEALRAVLHSGDRSRVMEELAAYRERVGQTAYEIAFSGGQYTDPRGPFYGGTAASHSRQVIEALIDLWQLDRRLLAVVDVHSGLGPYGYGEVICDHPLQSLGVSTARRWYGPACTLPLDGSSSSVPKWGLLDYAWHRIMVRGGCFVTLEYGTLGTDNLFDVLLRDSACQSAGPIRADAARAIAADMRHHFCPDDPLWRESVLFRSRQVITQALNGLVTTELL
ncbi:MAG: hypothetical protein CMK32_14430 [Porticoccaceae bacterium]|nr:hypothetical protein [Porticoccaceae bacterium]